MTDTPLHVTVCESIADVAVALEPADRIGDCPAGLIDAIAAILAEVVCDAGRDGEADDIAREVVAAILAAGYAILPLPHITSAARSTTGTFAGQLAALGVPAPWRLSEGEVGVLLAENSADAAVADPSGSATDAAATTLAALIMCAVNTCAGYRAVAPTPDTPTEESAP